MSAINYSERILNRNILVICIQVEHKKLVKRTLGIFEDY